MKKCLLSFLLISILCIPSSFAQFSPLMFKHLTTDDGLSHNTVNCILQDKKGFLWFATMNGLNKYDGYRFTNYENRSIETSKQGSSRINSICEDKLGRIWVASVGLSYFDRQTEKIVHFDPKDPASKLLNSVFVNCLFLSDDNILWLGTEEGLIKLDISKDAVAHPKYKYFKHKANDPSSLEDDNIQSIFLDHRGDLWLGLAHQSCFMNRFSPKTERFEHIKYKIESIHTYAIKEDAQHNLWIGSWGQGVFKLDPTRKIFTNYRSDNGDRSGLSSNIVLNIHIDKSNNIWFGTRGGGINTWNPSSQTFNKYTSDPLNKMSLNSDFIQTLYQDRNGILWAGTNGNGINYTDGMDKKFKAIDIKSLAEVGFKGYGVNAICISKEGLIYIGTQDGNLNVYDAQKRYVRSIPVHRAYPVSKIFQDKQGNLLIGSDGDGLAVISAKSIASGAYSFENFKFGGEPSKSLSNNYIYDIAQDLNGIVWLGSWGGGLSKFNVEKRSFVHFDLHSKNQKGMVTDVVTALLPSSKGDIWFGSKDGLFRFHPNPVKDSLNIISHYTYDPSKENTLPNNYILSIYEDKKGRIWLVGENGLCKMTVDEDGQSHFINYSTKDGLLGNTVTGILEDNSGYIWLCGEKGLSKFDTKKKLFKNYDVNDGLHSNLFHTKCSSISKTGELYFGGSNGFTSFYPEEIKENLIKPSVAITDFKIYNQTVGINDTINGRVVLKKAISETDTIVLTNAESVFSFDFSALHFSAPSKNNYAYMMQGFDKTWQYVDAKRRFATYTNLPSGKYIFMVRASNNESVWNPESKNILLIILPPWWRSWWAYCIYFLIVLEVAYLIRKYILIENKLVLDQLEKEKNKELNNSKLMFFTNISHELRTPLTLILGPAEHLNQLDIADEDIRQNISFIYRNSQRLLRLINQLLEFRKAETEEMVLSIQNYDIIQQIKQIKQNFDILAKEHKIDYRLVTPVNSFNMWADPDKVEKIMFNLLSNAFKFTEQDGSITIRISLLSSNEAKEQNFIELTVSDTGIGIPADDVGKVFDRFYQVDDSKNTGGNKIQQGTGIGLALAKKLVEMHCGTITIESEQGKGSDFTVKLPVELQSGAKYKIADTIETYGTLVHDTDGLSTINAKASDPEQRSQILIVEDDTDIRTYLHRILSQDYIVFTAKNGLEGIRECLNSQPELIISDVTMPLMGGFEFCQKIKTDIRTCHIPVILLTSKTSLESQIEGLKTGADDYIGKPFNADTLKLKVKNKLKTRKELIKKFNEHTDIDTKEVTMNALDAEFLQKVIRIVDQNMRDYRFDVEKFSHEVGVSRSQLHAKLKALTDLAPSDFLRNQRLKKSANLLKEGRMTVSEICFEVGFASHSYFTKCFKNQFGVSPSDYLKR